MKKKVKVRVKKQDKLTVQDPQPKALVRDPRMNPPDGQHNPITNEPIHPARGRHTPIIQEPPISTKPEEPPDLRRDPVTNELLNPPVNKPQEQPDKHE